MHDHQKAGLMDGWSWALCQNLGIRRVLGKSMILDGNIIIYIPLDPVSKLDMFFGVLPSDTVARLFPLHIEVDSVPASKTGRRRLKTTVFVAKCPQPTGLVPVAFRQSYCVGCEPCRESTNGRSLELTDISSTGPFENSIPRFTGMGR